MVLRKRKKLNSENSRTGHLISTIEMLTDKPQISIIALEKSKIMILPSSYILDRENIKVKAYRLICHFYANKEISRQSDPECRDGGIAKLEDQYFFKEISKLLLELAISIRVLDDQMKSLPQSSKIRSAYFESMAQVNSGYNCMMFDEMTLREVCNKIIHANVVEPHIEESENGDHQIDHYNWLGWSESIEYSEDKDIPKPEPIKWKRLKNNVRLGGTHRREQWWHLLQIRIFVEAITELLS